jgi:hypothetical protein
MNIPNNEENRFVSTVPLIENVINIILAFGLKHCHENK